MKLKKYLDELKKRFLEISNEDSRAKIGTRDFVATLVFCFSRDRGNFRTLDCIRKFIQITHDVTLSRGPSGKGSQPRSFTKYLKKWWQACFRILPANCQLPETY